MQLLGRHRVRATFYHLVAIVFLVSTGLWCLDLISDKASFIISATLFVVDYIAEMYDPHPDTPGPWYAHFHRIYDGNEEHTCPVQEHINTLDARVEKLKNN